MSFDQSYWSLSLKNSGRRLGTVWICPDMHGNWVRKCLAQLILLQWGCLPIHGFNYLVFKSFHFPVHFCDSFHLCLFGIILHFLFGFLCGSYGAGGVCGGGAKGRSSPGDRERVITSSPFNILRQCLSISRHRFVGGGGGAGHQTWLSCNGERNKQLLMTSLLRKM